jgi:hypothetical protein
MRKVTKGEMFRVHIELNDRLIEKMKAAPDLALNAVQKVAEHWHETFLPQHFAPNAKFRYGYARRSAKYLKRSQKKNKPDLVFSGSLQRDLTTKAQMVHGARFVALRMFARVLNFVPNVPEAVTDKKVRRSDGKLYPNIKMEVRKILRMEERPLAQVAKQAMREQFVAALAK